MRVVALTLPDTFDRVDRVKQAIGQKPLRGDDRLWILGQPLVAVLDDGFDITSTVTVPRCNGRPVVGRPDLGDLPEVRKSYADRAFRAVLRAAGRDEAERGKDPDRVHPVRCTVMYLAVHLFGRWAYRSDQADGPTIRV